MEVHWKFGFRSLRNNTLYTVSIYDADYTGEPIVLHGAARPFETTESDDDDILIPIRSQTGYLRIVDDGYGNQSNSRVAFDWKDLLPNTDTDRPVVLTHEYNGETVIDWQGFMQAQNFSGTLYEKPQLREYPIHCALSPLEGIDMMYQNKEIKNFAYLLQFVVNGISNLSGGNATTPGKVHIEKIIVQGGDDAREWLLKRIDWQSFADTEEDGSMKARYSVLSALEEMCRFWGWTARTFGSTLYLVKPYDADEQLFLLLTPSDLQALADDTDGTATAGTLLNRFPIISVTGDIFSSVKNEDYRASGYRKAIFTADCSQGEENVISFIDEHARDEMKEMGWQSVNFAQDNTRYCVYSNNKYWFSRPLLSCEAVQGYASFNEKVRSDGLTSTTEPVIKMEAQALSNGSPSVTLASGYHHLFHDGVLEFYCDTYKGCDKYSSTSGDSEAGTSYMYVRIGIGKTRATAKWYNGEHGQWQDQPVKVKMTVGNKGNKMFISEYITYLNVIRFVVYAPQISVSGLEGQLFIDLFPVVDNASSSVAGHYISMDLSNFRVNFHRCKNVMEFVEGNRIMYDANRKTSNKYVATNANRSSKDWREEANFASEKNMKFGYGVIMNTDKTYLTTTTFRGNSERPEQHLVNAVANFWERARRMMQLELRSDAINASNITPGSRTLIDATTGYPMSISHEWRDDKIIVKIIEL